MHIDLTLLLIFLNKSTQSLQFSTSYPLWLHEAKHILNDDAADSSELSISWNNKLERWTIVEIFFILLYTKERFLLKHGTYFVTERQFTSYNFRFVVKRINITARSFPVVSSYSFAKWFL